jgi:hypothetical protein
MFFAVMEITHHHQCEISFSLHTDFSSIFPVPTNVLGFGRSIFCEKRLTTCPPAVKLGTLIRQDILCFSSL